MGQWTGTNFALSSTHALIVYSTHRIAHHVARFYLYGGQCVAAGSNRWLIICAPRFGNGRARCVICLFRVHWACSAQLTHIVRDARTTIFPVHCTHTGKMSCPSVLASGTRRGEVCGRTAWRPEQYGAYCRYHYRQFTQQQQQQQMIGTNDSTDVPTVVAHDTTTTTTTTTNGTQVAQETNCSHSESSTTNSDNDDDCKSIIASAGKDANQPRLPPRVDCAVRVTQRAPFDEQWFLRQLQELADYMRPVTEALERHQQHRLRTEGPWW